LSPTSRISTAHWRQRCRRHEGDVEGPDDLLHSAHKDAHLLESLASTTMSTRKFG
jgi:hypothetical protein